MENEKLYFHKRVGGWGNPNFPPPAASIPCPYHPDTGRGNFSSTSALAQHLAHGVVTEALLKGEEKWRLGEWLRDRGRRARELIFPKARSTP